MNVRQILGQKAVAGTLTVAPDAPMMDAVRVMAEKRVGALVVTRDGKRIDGILSERDVVRELGRRGAACLQDRVRDLMTARVSSCRMEDTAEQVLSGMTEGRFRHMPVLVGGELAGVISIGDVVKARLSEIDMEKNALEDMIRGF